MRAGFQSGSQAGYPPRGPRGRCYPPASYSEASGPHSSHIPLRREGDMEGGRERKRVGGRGAFLVAAALSSRKVRASSLLSQPTLSADTITKTPNARRMSGLLFKETNGSQVTVSMRRQGEMEEDGPHT